MSDRRLAILSYHKIGEPSHDAWKTWYYVPEETFAAQLRFLKDAGWQPIDSEAFLRALDEPESVPERSVLVTFDDAYRSVLDCALPWMTRLGFPGVIFAPTAYIGTRSDFDANTAEPPEPICSWEELQELERHGVSAQSHGVSHRGLSELALELVEAELSGSRAALEDRLGKEVRIYAYAYGDAGTDEAAIDAALERSGYRAACLFGGRALELPAADRYRLSRIPMWPDTDLAAELK